MRTLAACSSELGPDLMVVGEPTSVLTVAGSSVVVAPSAGTVVATGTVVVTAPATGGRVAGAADPLVAVAPLTAVAGPAVAALAPLVEADEAPPEGAVPPEGLDEPPLGAVPLAKVMGANTSLVADALPWAPMV
jgi:hypothetical protein